MKTHQNLSLYMSAICLSACATGHSAADYRKAHFDNLPNKNVRLEKQLAEREPANCNAEILAQTDEEAKPLVRIPPFMPPGAVTSGTCKVKLDVNHMGRPVKIETLNCTDEIFDFSARESISKWRYLPLFIGDTAVASCDIETTITFVLVDENGERIEM